MEDKTFIKKCEICLVDATCLCFKCMSYYCDSCFKIIHDKQLKSQHKKVVIDPYVPIDLKCPEHPKIANNLFCADDKGKF